MEDGKIWNLLNEAIVDQFGQVSDSEPGSKAEQTATEDLVKLYRLANDTVKIENEHLEAEARQKAESLQREEEFELKSRELDVRERKERNEQVWTKISTIATAVVGIGGLVLSAAELSLLRRTIVAGYEFEKEGTFTSTTMRNSLSMLFKRKRR